MTELVESKTNDNEENGEDNETTKLNRLSSNCIDSRHGHPVTWNSSSTNQNQITNGCISENVVDIWTSSIANGCQNGSIVQTKTIESDVKEEP